MAELNHVGKLMLRSTLLIILSAVLILVLREPVYSGNKFIVLASTTSTVNSGLFDNILPAFTEKTAISVRVLGVGTGQAIKVAERGDADVLFVHHKNSELNFVKRGFGVKRYDVMYNDFVVVGPKMDPAGIQSVKSVVAAYKKIAATNSMFLSRGDDSGTHKRSLEFWRQAAVDVSSASGKWYRETGSGMGATLNIAMSVNGYTLTDRATWEAFKNKGSLNLVFEGGPSLRNQYGIIMVSPSLHKHVKVNLASAFVEWLISEGGQTAINGFRLNGNQMFFANANRRQNTIQKSDYLTPGTRQ